VKTIVCPRGKVRDLSAIICSAETIQSIPFQDPVVGVDIAKVFSNHEGSVFLDLRGVDKPISQLVGEIVDLTDAALGTTSEVMASKLGNPNRHSVSKPAADVVLYIADIRSIDMNGEEVTAVPDISFASVDELIHPYFARWTVGNTWATDFGTAIPKGLENIYVNSACAPGIHVGLLAVIGLIGSKNVLVLSWSDVVADIIDIFPPPEHGNGLNANISAAFGGCGFQL